MGNARRDNQGKIDMTHLSRVACEEECKVWMLGEKKYGRNNWKKLWGDDTINIVMASLMRHAFKIISGELYDEETGLPHASHIRCNTAMLLEYMHKTNTLRKSPEENMINISYSVQEKGLNGCTLFLREMASIPFSKLAEYKDKYENVKIIKDKDNTDNKIKGTFFKGGKL